jgi:hypothetical protein
MRWQRIASLLGCRCRSVLALAYNEVYMRS